MSAYGLPHDAAYPGMLADAAPHTCRSMISGETSLGIPTGCAVKKGTTDNTVKLPSALTDHIVGIAVYSDQLANPIDIDDNGIKPATAFSILERGTIWVAVEEAVTRDDPAYVRVAASVNTPALTQLGAFRKTPDGVAQVSTITPTPLNSAVSELRVTFTSGPNAGKSFVFEFQADASATAAEWVTGMKAAMAKDVVFSALITTSGTNTLILTGATAGLTFEVEDVGDQTNAIAATTPAAPTAAALAGARFLTTQATPGGMAMLSFDANRP